MHFFTLLAAAGTAALAFAAPTSEAKKRATKLEFFGVNESGAEFGEANIPGVYNTDYTWYNLSTIDVIMICCPVLFHDLMVTTRPSSPRE